MGVSTVNTALFFILTLSLGVFAIYTLTSITLGHYKPLIEPYCASHPDSYLHFQYLPWLDGINCLITAFFEDFASGSNTFVTDLIRIPCMISLSSLFLSLSLFSLSPFSFSFISFSLSSLFPLSSLFISLSSFYPSLSLVSPMCRYLLSLSLLLDHTFLSLLISI
jgi:hypothetical protein